MSKLTDWLLAHPFRSALETRVQQAVKVMDDEYWHNMAGQPLIARPWYKVRDQLEDIFETCRENPLAQRIIGLTTDFVVGDTVTVTGGDYVHRFWEHPLNNMEARIYRWCDELTRSGELFIVLSTNPADGMAYVREISALQIDQIVLDQDDIEKEYRFHQLTSDVEGHWWPSAITHVEVIPRGHQAQPPDAPNQIMLHYTINKQVGDIRGVSDLAQILTWLNRYNMWLEDRVRINRYKGSYLWHVQVQNALPATLAAKKAQYSRPPKPGSIIVSDATETWTAVQPDINADRVEADGKALRLMIAAGSGIPLHFLGEGESATRATAREMGTATYRHFAHRQRVFSNIVEHVIRTACQRAAQNPDGLSVDFEPILDQAQYPGQENRPDTPGTDQPAPDNQDDQDEH